MDNNYDDKTNENMENNDNDDNNNESNKDIDDDIDDNGYKPLHNYTENIDAKKDDNKD